MMSLVEQLIPWKDDCISEAKRLINLIIAGEIFAVDVLGLMLFQD